MSKEITKSHAREIGQKVTSSQAFDQTLIEFNHRHEQIIACPVNASTSQEVYQKILDTLSRIKDQSKTIPRNWRDSHEFKQGLKDVVSHLKENPIEAIYDPKDDDYERPFELERFIVLNRREGGGISNLSYLEFDK